MNRRTHWLLYLLLIFALELPAYTCGPDFASAIFFLPHHPDGNYTAFVRGHLAILQPGFHTRDLVVAYRYLSGLPLDESEQQQAAAANDHFMNPEPNAEWSYPDPNKPPPPTPFGTWINARAKFGPVDHYVPTVMLATDRTPPGGNYSSFPNCLPPAFATATATLLARSQRYGAHSPEVIEWVRGQDAVFSNCGDGKPPQYFGPGKPPTPPPAPHPPATLSNVPQWLQQDRAYQLAAASFYATDYDTAITRFRAIAADTASPWSVTARYLVGRALIRKATLFDTTSQPATPSSTAKFVADLTTARTEFLTMRAEPRMAPLLPSINGLIDFLNLRIEPEAQAITLAHRALLPNSPRYGQLLIDLTALSTSSDDDQDTLIPAPDNTQRIASRSIVRTQSDSERAIDLLNWIDALNNKKADTALDHWRSSRKPVWLVAALMFANPSDPQTPELVAAAAIIPITDPAYLTVTYHRLRLMPHDPATRTQLLALLPQLRKTEGPSAINLFSTLTGATAPTLQDWLLTAARNPAGETSYDEIDDDSVTPPKENVCGTAITQSEYKLFDGDAAFAFNQQLPLRLIAAAAESSILPANLRYDVAQAAWTRAVLLDQPNIARRMTPLLISCRPAWKPVLDAYNSATTTTARHAEGLLALLRFASTEPSVREGEERRDGFATYDEYRQNWWCTTVPTIGSDVDAPIDTTYARPAHATMPPAPPPFLTPADLAKASKEVAALKKIPNAGTYFAHQALTWASAHPNDSRTPDILGEATRALRNNCRNDNPKDPDRTAVLAHQLFDALHQHYPASIWTKRFSTWE